METYRDGIACHRELAKVKAELVQARETEREYYRNAISSFVASVRAEGELKRERDAANVRLDKIRQLCTECEFDGIVVTKDDATIASYALVDDIRTALAGPTE